MGCRAYVKTSKEKRTRKFTWRLRSKQRIQGGMSERSVDNYDSRKRFKSPR